VKPAARDLPAARRSPPGGRAPVEAPRTWPRPVVIGITTLGEPDHSTKASSKLGCNRVTMDSTEIVAQAGSKPRQWEENGFGRHHTVGPRRGAAWT